MQYFVHKVKRNKDFTKKNLLPDVSPPPECATAEACYAPIVADELLLKKVLQFL